MTGYSGQYVLIGDSGFTLSPFLMIPYSRRQSRADRTKRDFNNLLSAERVKAEHVIKDVKISFQMLRHPLRLKLEHLPDFIVACFVLHNVHKYLKDGHTYAYEGGESGSDSSCGCSGSSSSSSSSSSSDSDFDSDSSGSDMGVQQALGMW